MITYNDLYETLRKERYSEQLQPLSKTFLQDVVDYFNEKKEIAGKQGDLFSDAIMKTKKQFENAIGLFKELMMRRRKKLMTLAFVASETGISKRDFENMIEFEKKLFDDIVKSMAEQEKQLSEFLNGKKTDEKKNRMILFKEDVEGFLGISGENLGPFKKGDIANLPVEIVNILKDGDKAEFIDEM